MHMAKKFRANKGEANQVLDDYAVYKIIKVRLKRKWKFNYRK